MSGAQSLTDGGDHGCKVFALVACNAQILSIVVELYSMRTSKYVACQDARLLVECHFQVSTALKCPNAGQPATYFVLLSFF